MSDRQTESEILERFGEVLGDLLGRERVELARDTERDDVDGWDSFAYVNFIVAIEIEYGIQFNVADVESFVTVGDILDQTLKLLA